MVSAEPANGKPKKRTSKASREKITTPSQIHPPANPPKRKRSYAMVAVTKPAQTSNQPWAKVSYRNWKNIIVKPQVVKVEQRRRKILFPCKIGG